MRLVSTVAILALSLVHPALCPAQQRDAVAAAPGGAASRTTKQQLDSVLLAVRRADPVALWDLLPLSYQVEIDGLANELGKRLDAKTTERAARLFRRFAQVAMDKQDLVFGSAALRTSALADPRSATAARAAYAKFCGQVRDLGKSDLVTREGLREFDGRTFCSGDGKALVDAFVKFMLLAGHDPRPGLEQMQLRVVDETAGRVSVEMTVQGQSTTRLQIASFAETAEFAKVEGRVVPAKLADEWMPAIRRLNVQFAATRAKTDPALAAQVTVLIGAAEGVLREIEEADTQADFDAALQRLLGTSAARTPPTPAR